MIYIYKIGLDNYLQNDKFIDRNSGLFEYQIIAKELQDIDTERSIMILINGKCSNDEESRILAFMKQFDTVVFVASDIIAFSDNKRLIENSDYLLHQRPEGYIDEYNHIKQRYSWIPELFYKYTKPACSSTSKLQRIIFGGGVRDNEKLINEYLNSTASTAYVKTEAYDNRLDYMNYLNELSKHKYSLIVSRKAYSEIGWVTARYAEALAVNTLPICDKDYDSNNHYRTIRVFEPTDLATVINMFNDNDDYYTATLLDMKNTIAKNVGNFKKLIIRICRGVSW